MLGKLAKWLRILGFDAVFFSKIDDDDLLSLAKAEGRILLTRDSGLVERAVEIRTLLVHSEFWREQVNQVLDDMEARDKARPHSRCIECNSLLKSLTKERAKNLVTPFIYERSEEFALCPGCGRVFWRGTHLEDMENKIDEILKREN